MKENYKVAIISDTHGLLREEIFDILKTCDYIIHAGDINTEDILKRLEEVSPVYVVRGNNDKGRWAEALPKDLHFNIGNIRFYMVHNKKDMHFEFKDIDIVVFGHSHKYFYETIGNLTYLNPGSCGKRRFNLPISLAIITIENNNYNIEKIEI
ncbi:metallophosphoesterase family protein [Terrisporobacter sp.]